MTLHQPAPRVAPDVLDDLQGRTRGRVVRPHDPDYDEARRVFNGMHDRRPVAVVQARDAADARATVALARDHGLPLAVRGGGHSVAGFSTCDDGVVLDLGGMTGVRVDPGEGTVQAQGGCTWGDVDHATHAFGLATTGGVVSTTGVAGLTLGGGMGYLTRPCGLACDNLLAADVVTADGRFLTCSVDAHADLFWALRGGGGNFGVVTSLTYRLHRVGDVLGGPVVFRLDADVLTAFAARMADAPDALGAVMGLALCPPVPFVPEGHHGTPVAVLIVCWTGRPDEGERVVASLGDLGEVLGSGVARMPYPVINTLFDALLPFGLRSYWKAAYATGMGTEAGAAHVEHARRWPTPEAGTFVFPLSGAAARAGTADTAFPHRGGGLAMALSGIWPDAADDEANIAMVRAYAEAVRPFSEEGAYVNFVADDDADRVTANYGPNLARLRSVKAAYDPHNLFRLNQNVTPA